MPWKQRGRRSYYYQSKRQGGKVTTEYVGGGPIAELAAQSDEAERLRKAARRERRRRLIARENDIDKQLDELGEAVNAMIAATLVIGGYRLHKRSTWRRKRSDNNN